MTYLTVLSVFQNCLENYKGQNIYKVLLEKHMLNYNNGVRDKGKEKL